MSRPGTSEIERMITKYRDQRRAEAGAPLELHKAAREELHEEVAERFGTGFVSAQESAENFARTVAWQQNVGRWWHALVPKIGFAGACFAAVMVVFSIVHRESQKTAAPTVTSDFLDMPPLEEKVETAPPEIVPEAPQALDDAPAATPKPPPSPTPPPATPEPRAAAKTVPTPAPAGITEPQPEPAAAMLADESPAPPKPKPALKRASLDQPRPEPTRKPTVTPKPKAKAKISPPVWKQKSAQEIEVVLPEEPPAPIAIVSEPPAPPAMPVAAAPAEFAVAPPVPAEPPTPKPARTTAPAPFRGPLLRAAFAADRIQPVLSRFDVVLEKGTIAIRDTDGSIYRGKVGSATSGAAKFTARGTSRKLRVSVMIDGRLMLAAAANAHAIQADVLLGDGRRFRLNARQR